jgi:hypothetical protein
MRRILVADHGNDWQGDADVVVWLGKRGARARGRSVVIEPSSVRAAALYLASAGAAEVSLRLRDPLAFVSELARLQAEPALRAAA